MNWLTKNLLNMNAQGAQRQCYSSHMEMHVLRITLCPLFVKHTR